MFGRFPDLLLGPMKWGWRFHVPFPVSLVTEVSPFWSTNGEKSLRLVKESETRATYPVRADNT